MSCQTTCILGENLTFTVQCLAGTGAPVAATGTVAYNVYEDETSTAILTGTMTQLASKTGFYSEQIATTAANGFERWKTYTVRISATVDSVSVAKTYSVLCLGAEDTPTASTGALTTTANYKSYAGITHTDDDTLIGYLVSRATSAIEEYCGRILRSDTYRHRYDGDGESELLLDQYPVTDLIYCSTSTQDVLRIENTSSNAYNAYVTVVENDEDNSIAETMTLVVQGGTNAGSNSLTLADYTVTELAAAIVALGSGWTATVGNSTVGVWESIELLPAAGLQCLDCIARIQAPYDPATAAMLDYKSGQLFLTSKFPRGRRNIIVKYTAGYVTTPADLEQICIDLVNVYYRGRKKDLSVKAERLGDHAITMADDSRDLPKTIQVRLAPYKRWLR